MKIGIIREGKNPPDRRVAFTPEQCLEIQQKYPSIQCVVQPSAIRCIPDEAYQQKGIALQENLEECDVLFGVKEVPIPELIAQKTYFFFSHTIKKQPYNRNLLCTVLEKNIRLIDYECLKNTQGKRVVAFGRFAGLVGAYEGFLVFGQKSGLFSLKPPQNCQNLEEMSQELRKMVLPPLKIILTGSGRVGKGALEILKIAGIEAVSPEDFISKNFDKPVFTHLGSKDYYKATKPERVHADFYEYPEDFESYFFQYLRHAHLFISAHYWNPKAPALFSADDLETPHQLQVVADITCDIAGSVPCTLKTSTITEPVYDYVPSLRNIADAYTSPQNISIMAIDNLPTALPYDASQSFGEQLIKEVIPVLVGLGDEKVLARATIAEKGQLGSSFTYLQDYVSGCYEEVR
ncbi:MAG: alanine dehydrogenase [Cytophagales bacterium]|nr:MAG: alanine dehydrogenase [Cytophagales bacterium]